MNTVGEKMDHTFGHLASSSNKDVKAPTAAFLKAYPMKSKATGPPDKSYQQMFIGSLIWSEYKELKCSILKAGPWWLPHKLPSGRNISSLYYSVRRAMLMKEFRSAAQGSVRQQRKRFTDAKQLPSKTMKKSKKTDVIVGKGDAAAGDCVTVSPDLTSAIALSSSSDAPSSSNVFDQTRALDLIIADKLATLEKDRKSKYSYYPNYWLPFLLFGPANEAPLASFIATVKPAYVKAESGAHTSAMGRSARRVSSAMTAGHQFGGEYSPLIVQQVLSDANSLSVVAAKIIPRRLLLLCLQPLSVCCMNSKTRHAPLPPIRCKHSTMLLNTKLAVSGNFYNFT